MYESSHSVSGLRQGVNFLFRTCVNTISYDYGNTTVLFRLETPLARGQYSVKLLASRNSLDVKREDGEEKSKILDDQ